MFPTDELIKSVQNLSAKELESALQRREAEDKVLRTLYRAVRNRERKAARQEREAARCEN